MRNTKNNSFIIKKLLIKTIFMIGCTGIFTSIKLPVISQEYTLIDLFQPYEDSDDNEDSDDSSETNTYKSGTDNLLDKLNKDTNKFNNLVYAIESAGLTETLKNKYFVLIAPNDDAFEALPDRMFDKYNEPENQLVVLEYHLIPTKVIPENPKEVKVKTLGGNEITVSNHNGVIKINDAEAKIPSIGATNGVIIEIDKVLFPPNF